MAILVIEQNIGVATTVSENVAIMVNGRINRIIESRRLAADRELQQRLLGVGRHSDADPDPDDESAREAAAPSPSAARPAAAPIRLYVSNPTPPTRWSQPVPNARIEASARIASVGPARIEAIAEPRPARRRRPAGRARGRHARHQGNGTALHPRPHRRKRPARAPGRRLDQRQARDLRRDGAGDRAQPWPRRRRPCSAASAALRWPRWPRRSKPGSSGRATSPESSARAARAAPRSSRPAMRALPIGAPKMLDLLDRLRRRRPLCRPDRHHDDVFGHRRPGPERHLAAGAGERRAGADRDGQGAPQRARRSRERRRVRRTALPAVGLTMFGVTTPCVQQITAALAADWECLVFHATGVGGRSMEKLVDSGLHLGRHRRHHHRSRRHADGRRPGGRRGPVRRDHPHAGALCRLGRRARHGQFRPPSTLCRPRTRAAFCTRTIRR